MNRRVEYREYPPPPALQRHVRCLWHLRVAAAPESVDTVYPDGCCEIVVHRTEPMHVFDDALGWRQQARSVFAAQQLSAVRLAARSDADCLGVRLQPAASGCLAGPQLPRLRDRIVPLASLDANWEVCLVAAASQADVHSAVADVFALLGERLQPIDERVADAVAALEASAGMQPIASLAAAGGMSARAFQNAFRTHVGLSAKEFARIQRLQATIRRLDAADRPMAELAIESGFADQAHATREVRRVTGTTPARLRDALRDDRDGESSVRLAAAFVRGRERL